MTMTEHILDVTSEFNPWVERMSNGDAYVYWERRNPWTYASVHPDDFADLIGIESDMINITGNLLVLHVPSDVDQNCRQSA